MKEGSCLYFGNVVHVRQQPRQHRLKYGVFSMLIDLENTDSTARKCKLFSKNKFNLFSFYDCDHGDGKTPLIYWVKKQLSTAGINISGGTIKLLCYPRILGYVFNPISTYFCYGPDQKLRAIIYEVQNTFKEKHCYLIPVAKGDDKLIRQKSRKELYVSPFISMNATYDFRIERPDERVVLTIVEHEADKLLLQASFVGKRRELNDKTLLVAFFLYPLMTLKVIIGIHWEAFHLFRKRTSRYKKPPPTQISISIQNKTKDGQ